MLLGAMADMLHPPQRIMFGHSWSCDGRCRVEAAVQEATAESSSSCGRVSHVFFCMLSATVNEASCALSLPHSFPVPSTCPRRTDVPHRSCRGGTTSGFGGGYTSHIIPISASATLPVSAWPKAAFFVTVCLCVRAFVWGRGGARISKR